MGFIDFANGDVFDETAADLLMRQTVIVCTSGTHPAGPNEGMVIYETDMDTMRVYNGSAWRLLMGPNAWAAYTPTWSATSAPAIGNGSLSGVWTQQGTTVHCQVSLTMGTTTTYGSGDWSFTLPVAAPSGTGTYVGAAFMKDATGNYFAGAVFTDSTTTVKIAANGVASLVSSTTPFTWANLDQLRFEITYQAA